MENRSRSLRYRSGHLNGASRVEQCLSRFLNKESPSFSKFDALIAPYEERIPKLMLQFDDLLAQGRLDDVQLLSRTSVVQFFCQRNHRLHEPYLW